MQNENKNLGIAIVGLGGAVGTTAVAGSLLIKKGIQDKTGLPLAEFDTLDLTPYENIHFNGWDIFDDNLYESALKHGVLNNEQLAAIKDDLKKITPWKAIANKDFCAGVTDNKISEYTLRDQVKVIQDNLSSFSKDIDAPVILINLASTEHAVEVTDPIFQTVEAFEKALDDNSNKISPAMVYAYAAIDMGVAYGNFTPSMGVDVPALIQFSQDRKVPVAGKDGKTGQTFVKTVVAPALRARALKVDGWFSTNILGNRDGQALAQPESLQSKVNTKGSVLDSCLNYKVENHMVQIHYYKPRGDDKEAWDNIDFTGFLGHKMQMKINFLCKDSILAAPLAIEIARCLNLASQRKQGGPIEALSVFFKAPLTADNKEPEHRFAIQQQNLIDWLHEDVTKENTKKIKAPEGAKSLV